MYTRLVHTSLEMFLEWLYKLQSIVSHTSPCTQFVFGFFISLMDLSEFRLMTLSVEEGKTRSSSLPGKNRIEKGPEATHSSLIKPNRLQMNPIYLHIGTKVCILYVDWASTYIPPRIDWPSMNWTYYIALYGLLPRGKQNNLLLILSCLF